MGAAEALRAAERDFFVYRRIWRANVFSLFVAPVLMLVAMGVILGDRVDSQADGLDGLDYITFLTPGLLAASAMQAASGYSLWPVMAGHRWLGFHRAMVAAPLGPTDILNGHLAWLTARAMLTSTVFVAAGALLGGVPSAWGVAAIPVGGLTAFAFGAPLSAWSARAEMDHSFDPIMRTGITPIMLFSGTFFPLSQLPAALELAAKALPLWHGVELARSATTGSGSLVAWVVHLLVLAGYVVVGWRWARSEFARRLTS